MHLWDLSCYLPAGHVVLRMSSFGTLPTRLDAAWALDLAGYRAASIEAGEHSAGFVPIDGLLLDGERIPPFGLVTPTWRALAWYVGYVPGVQAGDGSHAQDCRCPNCGARLTGPAPAEGRR